MATNRLKEILDSKKMSFSELKKLLEEKDVKVNNSQLSLYSSGKRNPKNKKIWVIISEVLNVELQEIITDINAYLTIMAEISENSSEKNAQTEKEKINDSLYQELLSLVDESMPSELEKVQRYCGLAATFEKLGEDIIEEGAVVIVPSGDSVVKKTNPAIAEQVRVNAALIKLDEWFELKRQSNNGDNPKSGEDWSEFT
ncbi:helix-turn-helix transcriptional regulator [Lactococcus lactis]|jgi:transcriptional regulator with XRE-family HTH domain|uniref:Helix-turn-helix transcriptional regulator n=1 Tax=Lactococcus lactis TaxID=1358 RepID=A0AAE4NS85_9LACT|nr:helix-turn-helix transcriptional regulator [Lactococcus lactis]KST92877.1 Phage protein [Lactococcus lactis subsp. lactis]MDV2633883.1 helix-turn-helix transcriptional regulator [Lactococcus lactis]